MSQPPPPPTRIAVIYYSATGNVQRMAAQIAEGARSRGAEVRVRHVPEVRQELLVSERQIWGRHRVDVDDPEATLDDLDWADGVAFGSPTRFGNVAGQLKLFMDQAGELWQEGRLVDKVATSFTSSQTPHGGQETTILALNNTLYHWGAIIVPLGYTVHEAFNGGGNPYGASTTSGPQVQAPDVDEEHAARAQGERLARITAAIVLGREHGLLAPHRARRSGNA